MSSSKEKNRGRLIELISQIPAKKSPEGWGHVASIAVGGLACVGFSRELPCLLVVSSSGRGVIDCKTGEKVERDYEENVGLDKHGLHCQGVGIIKDEIISLGGLYGGGLPLSNEAGESLDVVSPEWPESYLILSKPNKSLFFEGHQSGCTIMYTGYLRAYGFSWCGNYIVAACSSDLDIWSRKSVI
ncbi:hypothetical protein VC279_20275 [Xanthomonas sp. WHRI 10064A]|uniref:hypothetical protein n=1 Tax=unclassified Xanthomonas TaxID=2643310 RepID=UPI002B23A63D|nr:MULTISPECIES: hypothetical protein [unclassified Xanthomonas]MEA9589708.1 hypothetical protein [Xanthomonas sp. WHRI 10064B]MEA9616941.1 hypothetical protein [Xanthomonas sp. WHRI 10064A]